MAKRKQIEKTKNRKVTNKKNREHQDKTDGLSENVRVVYSGENNPHDG